MSIEGPAPVPAAKLDPPPPLAIATREWSRFITPVISLLVLAVAIFQLRFLDLSSLWANMPTRVDFWIVFVLRFFNGSIADWIIFNRIWKLPLAGIAPLLRKMVSNNLLFGYSGELYFYAWARRNSAISAAPFGAIKDVAILSALAGNLFTLGLVIYCWPSFELLHRNDLAKGLEWSIVFVLGLSLGITLLRGRLFSLPGRELRFVTIVHLIRISIDLVLTSYILHCLIPDVALSWLLFISTLRLLISRLPFLPNKELAFAALAAFFVGHDNVLVEAMVLSASLSLAAMLLLGTGLGATELIKEGRTGK